MSLRFHTLDVFTQSAYGGNPLAVVLGGDQLQTAQMQRIAREFNLSETVFVLAPTQSEALHRLRIFTPFKELPFAGHPTIGAATLLAELGLTPKGADIRFTLEEGVGLVPVLVRMTPGEASYAELSTAQPPQFAPGPDAATLAPLLGLDSQDLAGTSADGGREQPRIASCGNPFILVPLRSPELLAAIDFDPSGARKALAGAAARALYVYARGYEGELRTRMFAPELGVPEDPATGSAAVALGAALAAEASADGLYEWRIHQGLEMGRPSLLHVAAERSAGQVTAVRVGGHSVRIAEGTWGAI